MASGQKAAVLHQLGRLLGSGTVAGLSEWQLLERYLSQHDEAAFEALVARHGPMVLGVCRRILGNASDVDDAFQATFLILVKKARSLGERDAIGHWLYGVAHRVAVRARTVAAKRRLQQPNLAVVDESSEDNPSTPELGWVLEEELSRLRREYRAPIVLCYLQGMTHEEAASYLHWPLGTVKGRLARARALLKDRLIRRGIAPTAGAAIASLSRDASAHVPELLLHSTVTTAMRLTAGVAAQAIPATVTALLPGVFTTMFLTRTKVASALVSVLIVASAGAAVAQYAKDKSSRDRSGEQLTLKEKDSPTSPSQTLEVAGQAQVTAPAKLEQPNDPTVEDSLLSTLREKQRNLAAQIFSHELERLRIGESNDIAAIIQWSKKILEASNEQPGEKSHAMREHLMRAKAIANAVKNRPQEKGHPQENPSSLAAQFYLTEAEIMLAQARSNPEGSLSPLDEHYIPPSQRDVRSQNILKALEKPLDLAFPNETALEEVIQYIKAKTVTPEFPRGLPIYVDPVGLQEAEKTMSSPITIDIDGVALKTALKLLLLQLGMTYEVDSGVLRITSENSEGAPLTPILHLADRASKGELSIREMKDIIERYKLIFEIRRFSEGPAPESKPASPK